MKSKIYTKNTQFLLCDLKCADIYFERFHVNVGKNFFLPLNYFKKKNMINASKQRIQISND